MATSQISEVIQHLRSALLLRDGAGLTDGQLLEDYIRRRDKATLAALVHRHGRMVWGVCRRVLSNYHDAEDAFQATFLVLVRRAASIASPELLANWLYGVAHQTAMKARATVAKRKTRERQVTEMPEPAVVEQGDKGSIVEKTESHLGLIFVARSTLDIECLGIRSHLAQNGRLIKGDLGVNHPIYLLRRQHYANDPVDIQRRHPSFFFRHAYKIHRGHLAEEILPGFAFPPFADLQRGEGRGIGRQKVELRRLLVVLFGIHCGDQLFGRSNDIVIHGKATAPQN
jgi:RNA polymerase sigma factor (sigma-70 family)